MKTAIGFLMTYVVILLASRYVAADTILDSSLHAGLVGNLAFLGSLGLARRARRLKHNQAI